MTAIPVPVSSSPGIRPDEGAGRLVNCFAVKQEQGARFPVIWYRSAGLHLQADVVNHVHLRGAILAGSTLVSVFNSRVYAIDSTFTATNLGSLTGSDRVTLAKNNAGTPNIVVVTSAGVFNLFTASAPTAFADADLPASPTSVASIDGYFIWTYNNGDLYASGLNAVSVATNSFATEQALGGLLRGITFKGEFYAMGRLGIGLWKDKGLSPFPLEKQFTIEKGLIGTHAVAGWEPGWVGQLLWVAPDGIVYQMDGYVPKPVSNDDVTRDIVQAIFDGEGTTLEADVYMQGKHAFWRLTNPGMWTWEYNVTTQNWNERESFNRDDCRCSFTVNAFDQWLVGDRESGKVFQINESTTNEGDDPLIFEIVSGAVANYPARIMIPRADFDFTAGVGDATAEDDPQVQISWSFDGGFSYGNPVLRPLGVQADAGHQITVQRIGLTRGQGARFKLRVSDQVHVAFQGGQVPVEVRAAA